jgi:hypothetical protein
MGGYLPHINRLFADLHCTPFCPAGIPHWTQRRPRAARGVVADVRLA